MNKKKLYLASLGCTKNLVDSEVMLGVLKDYSLTNDETNADVLIVNTCGFINSAKEESIDTILELDANRKKDSILVVSGCLSERYKEDLKNALPEVDIFTGVGDYDKIDTLINEKKSHFSNKVFLSTKDNIRVITGSSYHAYIKLSEGCNQKCSFCAIPGFKGKLNSRSLENIKDEVLKLIDKGYTDLSFVSQDSSSYLRDKNIKNGLELLIDEMEKITKIKTARILYLYPSTTSLSLIDKIYKSEKFLNYFDMPLQHISPKILKLMKRGKKVDQLNELMDHMKQNDDAFIRTTFIVGYPGETEEDFNMLCDYVKNFGFSRANIFSYSDEEGTSAEQSKDKVPQELIDKRADFLGKIISENLEKNLKSDIGKTFKIYLDGESSEHEFLLSARKTIWAPEIDGEIYINDNTLKEKLEFGKMYEAKITDLAGDKLLGTIIKKCC